MSYFHAFAAFGSFPVFCMVTSQKGRFFRRPLFIFLLTLPVDDDVDRTERPLLSIARAFRFSFSLYFFPAANVFFFFLLVRPYSLFYFLLVSACTPSSPLCSLKTIALALFFIMFFVSLYLSRNKAFCLFFDSVRDNGASSYFILFLPSSLSVDCSLCRQKTPRHSL